MLKIINICDIFKRYYAIMKEDLKLIPRIILLVIIPIVIGIYTFYFINPTEIIQFILSIISTLIILLIIIYCHVNCNEYIKTADSIRKLKWQLLDRINIMITVIILISIIILFIKNINSLIPVALYLIGFIFVNLMIVIIRIYNLIMFELVDI